MRKICLTAASLLLAALPVWSQISVGFEDVQMGSGGYQDGFSATLGTFTTDLNIGGAVFHNTYTRSDWGFGLTESFSGFAYSKETDNTTPGYGNQYSCVAGTGSGGSPVYGLFYANPAQTVFFDQATTITSIDLCNSTYAYYSMLEGDAFAKKFGGESGQDPDYFFVRIVGLSGDHRQDSTDFYLADFRFEDPAQDYLIQTWTTVDLQFMGEVTALEFSLHSSDTGDWGMNTPAYFCVDQFAGRDFDDLTFTSGNYWNGSTAALQGYESSFISGPVTLNNHYTLSDWGYGITGSFTGWALSGVSDRETPGYINQYAAIPGSGSAGSEQYALCYNSRGSDTLHLDKPYYAERIDLTNGTYPYWSMRNGDAFAKKFGGESGDDPDYFKLTISGYLDGQLTGSVDFYLADYRFENNDLDYILDEWQTVDLSTVGQVDQLVFSLNSSDMGDWGMNTPAYFFMDQLILSHTSGAGHDLAWAACHLYPNPAVDQVTIESVHTLQEVSVWSFDGKQQILKAAPNAQTVHLDVSALIPGSYIVIARSNQDVSHHIIIKN